MLTQGPTTGTWTQQDPINAPLNPYNANRYEYAADNPVNYTDPAGLWSWLELGAAAAGGITGGCAAGAIASIWTGPGALAACGIGALSTGVGAAVTDATIQGINAL